MSTDREFWERYRRGERRFRYERAPDRILFGNYEGCDFSGMDLRRSEITGRFSNCTFVGTRFQSALLMGSFSECDFTSCSLDHARISNALFRGGDFTKASLTDARITFVDFHVCNFHETRMSRVVFERVTFDAITPRAVWLDSSTFIDTSVEAFCLPGTTAGGMNAVVDWRSVCRSIRAPRLETFLLKSGMAEIFVRYVCDCARALDPEMMFKLMRSTFISYGEPDTEFALSLNEASRSSGVDTFLFIKDALPGERLHAVMRRGINKYDRMILVCSEASLSRNGVLNEIQECLAREARDGGASYLVPITIDDFVFRSTQTHAGVIRDRVVADFCGTRIGDKASTPEEQANARAKFKDAVHRLLAALKRDDADPARRLTLACGREHG